MGIKLVRFVKIKLKKKEKIYKKEKKVKKEFLLTTACTGLFAKICDDIHDLVSINLNFSIVRQKE